MFSFSSVTELIKYIQAVCDNDSRLKDMSVTGEISGFKKYPSGHCYFSLKDNESTISCVMFGFYANNLNFVPKDGLKVQVSCNAGIYGPNGKFQIYCKSMTELGKGDLREQFKALFEKLNKEGLFSPNYKKPIPSMPRKIGVITSSSGAVIHDIIRTLSRRNPFFDLVLYPSAVQGNQAPKEIISGIDFFETSNEINVDVLIIARGGGSFEDLYCFNDEDLARRIFECSIPIISAVGHEVDYTICDYVSDLRVATPTAAAEVVLPKFDDLEYTLSSIRNDLDNAIFGYINSQKNRLNSLKNHKALSGPEYQIRNEFSRLNEFTSRLNFIMDNRIKNENLVLKSLMERIDLTSPLKILQRGYSITYDSDGNTINSSKSLNLNDVITVQLSDSKVLATVNEILDKGE